MALKSLFVGSLLLKARYSEHMTVTLSPRAEQFVQDLLTRGTVGSPEEAIEQALETAAKISVVSPVGVSRRTPAEAVADIMELQRRNTLDGLTIKDMIQEGRKY